MKLYRSDAMLAQIICRDQANRAPCLSHNGACFLDPGPAASATNVGASSRSPSKTVAPRAAGSTVRQRKATSSGTRSGGRTTGSAGTGGMWRFYTEDSPGLKVWLWLIDGAVVVIECVSSAVKGGQTRHTVLCIECVFVPALDAGLKASLKDAL
ncbi:hypothetical protein ABVT39_026390 [Epinephelus coioides]